MAQINIKEAICEAIRQTVNYIKSKAVTSDVQTFTDEEKAQIRANIGVTSDGNTDTCSDWVKKNENNKVCPFCRR